MLFEIVLYAYTCNVLVHLQHAIFALMKIVSVVTKVELPNRQIRITVGCTTYMIYCTIIDSEYWGL